METEFNFIRGTSYSKIINITGYQGNIDEMYFTVKERETDRKPVIQKTLDSGITPLKNDEDVKSYRLLIKPEDTEGLTINKPYYFDIKVITSEEVEETTKIVIVRGTMTLDANITRSFNEK